MSDTPNTTITVRIPMDHLTTQADHKNAVGIDFLETQLTQAGWIDAAGTVLKLFKVSYSGGEEDGAFYIEWKAVLSK